MTIKWRARSASDKTDDWPFWYVTDDQPTDINKTPDAWKTLTGKDWRGLPFLPKDGALLMVNYLNRGGE